MIVFTAAVASQLLTQVTVNEESVEYFTNVKFSIAMTEPYGKAFYIFTVNV